MNYVDYMSKTIRTRPGEWLQHLVLLALRLYRAAISPVLTAVLGPMGWGCRFTPTCSQYALEAIREHGVIHGTWLVVRRLGRCHPWGDCGHDPVPKVPFQSQPAKAQAMRHGS
jgi:putative membrane protein insertion efficiency factor